MGAVIGTSSPENLYFCENKETQCHKYQKGLKICLLRQ